MFKLWFSMLDPVVEVVEREGVGGCTVGWGMGWRISGLRFVVILYLLLILRLERRILIFDKLSRGY
jgi:hypothetical protein